MTSTAEVLVFETTHHHPSATRRQLLGVVVAVLALLTMGMTYPSSEETHRVAPQSQDDDTAKCNDLDIVFVLDQSRSMSKDSWAHNDANEQRIYAPEYVIKEFLANQATGKCQGSTFRIAIVSYGDIAVINLPFTVYKPSSLEDARELSDDIWEKAMYGRNGLIDPETGNPVEMPATDHRAGLEEAIQILNKAPDVVDTGRLRKRAIIFLTDGMPCIPSTSYDGKYGHCDDLTTDHTAYLRDLETRIEEMAPFDPTLLEQERCIEDARQRHDVLYTVDLKETVQGNEDLVNCLDNYRVEPDAVKQSIYIFSLLLNARQDYLQIILDTFENISASHAGKRILLTENAMDIPTNFTVILSNLLKTKVIKLDCGTYAMNPYLREARFSFFKVDEEVEVTISYVDKDGVTHRLEKNVQKAGGFDVKKYYAHGANEVYHITRPYPGKWTLSTPGVCDSVDIFYEEIEFGFGGQAPLKIYSEELDKALVPGSSQLQMVQYEDDDYLNYFKIMDGFGSSDEGKTTDPGFAADRYYVQYQMFDKEGGQAVIVPDGDEHFWPRITLSIEEPDGRVTKYDMTWLEHEELYRSDTPIRLPLGGEYSITVEGKGVFRPPPYGPAAELWPPGGAATPVEKIFDQEKEIFRQEATFTAAEWSLDGYCSVEWAKDQICPEDSIADICPWDVTTEDSPYIFDGPFETSICQHEKQSAEYVCEQSHCETKYFDWEFVNPEEGQTLDGYVNGTAFDEGGNWWPLWAPTLPTNSFDIGFRFFDVEGRSFVADDVFDEPDSPLTLKVTRGSQEAEVLYTRDTGADSSYSGTVSTLHNPGSYTASGEALTTSAQDKYAGYYLLRPGSERIRIDFERLACPRRVPWLPSLCEFEAYSLARNILLIFLALIVARWLAARTNKVGGTLAFRDGPNTIAEFGLRSGKNWKVIKGRQLRNHPTLKLKRMKVTNIGKRKKSKEQEAQDAVSGSIYGAGLGTGVRVRCKDTDGRSYTLELEPSAPLDYGVPVAQMVYEPPGV